MDSPTSQAPPKQPADVSWHAVERWQQFDGEFRANVLRVVAVGCFYSVHLLHYYRGFGLFEMGEPPPRWFHQAVTLIAATWAFAATAIDQSLRYRIFPRWMPFITTTLDLAMITSIITLGGGQQSPLLPGYFLILILASLRGDLRLIRFATCVSLCCYLFLLAAGRWPAIVGQRQMGHVPRYGQIIMLLAIALSGVMLGQSIRRVRSMAIWYAGRSRLENEHA